ncbi:peptidoglycan-binding protein [Streptomyces sp. NRRL S-350]|uniref:peptidoglycan-binding protein n=1 Tax=Streptomyces sp. NRRL S-350 TaxID=1463902 RepID=UPI0004BE688F|nr:peptidoglycan-binding protein [Streptomyces sp. NRRL S-350]
MPNARGYDVSDYQDSIPADAEFAIIKATEGAHTDQQGYRAKLADARGRSLVIGHYHFFHAENDVQGEVDHFCAVVGDIPSGEFLALDFEPYGQDVDDTTATDRKNQWLAQVKARYPGHQVGLYANLDWWHRTDDECGDFLWIADYDSPPGAPAVQHPWAFHQTTDAPIDTNLYNGTVDQLHAWAGVPTPTPPAPAPDPASQPDTTPTEAPPSSPTPQWKQLLDHVASIPEQIYEGWNPNGGYDNHTPFGTEYGEDGVSWCVEYCWDMYHDTGLDSAVPKTDNVTAFSDWAKQHGQWSLYPSIGAWVNLGDGQHCEIVTGWDGDTVYTKGGNSIEAGSQDSGQGNGVWSHATPRRAARVTGYFAPTFPDHIAPPTADPQDYRGGPAVDSFNVPSAQLTPAPAPTPTPARYQVTIAGLRYGYGAVGDQVTVVGRALVAAGHGTHYQVGPGPAWGDADTLNYQDYQLSIGLQGTAPHQDADGVPGPESLRRLLGYLPGEVPPFPGRQAFADGQSNQYVLMLGEQLVRKGYGSHYRIGPSPAWSEADRLNVADFQHAQGWNGSSADGYPGPETWRLLFT